MLLWHALTGTVKETIRRTVRGTVTESFKELRRERRHQWYWRRRGPPGACRAKTTASPSHACSQCERCPIACSQQPRTARISCAPGVPECCSGARRERRHQWYWRRRGPPGACHAKATASPSPSLARNTNRRGVPECCSGARAQRERRHQWYWRRRGPPGACHAKATASPSHRLAARVSVPPSLARKGNGGTSGTGDGGDRQERAMPKVDRQLAVWLPGASAAVVALSFWTATDPNVCGPRIFNTRGHPNHDPKSACCYIIHVTAECCEGSD